MEFKEYTLSELAKGNKGSYGIGASAVDYDKELYTYLRITDINEDGTLNYANLKSVNDENADKYILEKGDIVFARTGNSTGKSYYYDGEISNLVYAGFLIKFSLDDKKVNPKFVKYYTITTEYKNWVKEIQTGSTRGNINEKMYGNMRMKLPPRDYQDKMVTILENVDKKIRLNNQINDNLYKVLNMIFQEYFCNKQDDENFEKVQIKDFISIRGGLAYKASLLSDNVDDNILVSMGNVELNTIFNFNNLKHYSENVENRYVGKIGDLFICTRDVTQKRNQLGCPGIIPKIFKGKNVIIGTNLYIVDILNNKKNIKYFLFLLMNSNEYRERIVGSAKGTAVLMIAKDDILKFEFCYPKEEKIIDDFNNKVTPIFEKIESVIVENDRLSNLRDTLLPKLMNGEIDLDKIKI